MGMDANVKELCICDLDIAMVHPAGVAADLSHLERKSAVKGYVHGKDEQAIGHLEECLTGCHLVLIPAGMPRNPGMTRDDLFKANADIDKGLVETCAKSGLDPLKIVGITTLDIVRAGKVVGEVTENNHISSTCR